MSHMIDPNDHKTMFEVRLRAMMEDPEFKRRFNALVSKSPRFRHLIQLAYSAGLEDAEAEQHRRN